jgi:hypothetical protein
MATRDDVDIGRWIDAMAGVLGLPVDTAWRDAVRANLDVLVQNMHVVEGLEIPDDVDPAPVFEA